MSDSLSPNNLSETDIAIVGMAAHVPGAADIGAYWQNLRDGIESIRVLDESALLAAGESPARIAKSNYVPAAAVLDGFEGFDADFFGFSPKEAAILDPQHRHFLEVAWEALENAGHPPEKFPGQIGVWAGCGMGSYFYFNLCSHRDLVDQTGMFLLRHTGNDKDFLATRVSHILDLKGPSINVQTACSTSLVAVHYATQALLNGECDMALAGGVTIELPHARGYLYTEGEILSPDGHCHAFDHRAQGTVFGSGAGCVVLRRAVDAVRDGDHIWAIIKGSAVNNDGAAKAGYLAPSVDGQARCIAEAQAMAGVSADSVSYIECHGTGTYLGDPIEVAALTAAFRETTDAVGSCRIGSVKTNIGHLDTAAGVASLIKVALALHHRELPPSLGYESPNPAIDFETSPFRVNDRLTAWNAPVLRAGVNSLGVGGTNAHAVLQQAPDRAPSALSDWPFQPLVLSARSKTALDAASTRLASHLRANPDQPLADVAYTLKDGRRAFDKRRVLVAATHAEAAAILDSADPRRVFTHDWLGDDPEVVFMFPGGGAQYAGMARDLYETEPVFADWMDRGLAVLEPKLDYDIRALWLPEKGTGAAASEALKKPSVQLPLIMITEYALAKLFESWGVTPTALVGHSMGENTAAALAGVMSFEDCIGLVHLRGTLFDTIAPGGMLSVPFSEPDLRKALVDLGFYLGENTPGGDSAAPLVQKPLTTGLAPGSTHQLDIASVNAPDLCVVSGPDHTLTALAGRLAATGVETQRIAIDIAAHSAMLQPILARFGDYLRSIPLHPPRLPIISNQTGVALTTAQATDPDYWVRHLRGTVNFRACMATLMAEPGRVYIEMGPGRALSSLAQANGVASGQVIPALRHPDQLMADDAWHMVTLARLWACGVAVDWDQIWGEGPRQRVPLPTYAFQKKPYFIAPAVGQTVEAAALPARINDVSGWGWAAHWRPVAAGFDLDDLADAPPETWLFFLDDTGLCATVADRLAAAGHRVVRVRSGDAFSRDSRGDYRLSPERGREGYDSLIRDLVSRGLAPSRIVHGWLVTDKESFRPGSSFLHRNIEQGFYSLLFLAQALAEENLPRPIRVTALTSGAAQVRGEPLAYPEKAMVLGPARVIPREVPGVQVGLLDIGPGDAIGAVLEEVLSDVPTISAWRGGRRYESGVRAVPLPDGGFDLPKGAHVLITGGFGGIGLTVAESLIRRFGAKITLIARRALPERGLWPAALAKAGPDDPVARRILALQRLEGLGGEVLVARADVANLDDMQTAKAAGEARFGPVHAVIHAAGVVDDGPLMTKSPAEVEEVFAPKLHGTQVLERLFADGSLALMVLFSSTSTITGPAGQIDYVAANEYLNAYAKARAGGKTRVVALNWGIWQGVGMAAEALADRTGRPEAPRIPITAPMLDEQGFDRHGNRVFWASYGPDRWVLDGHRTKDGTALIPGTGYLEIMAEAWAAQGEGDAFEIRDLTFFRALDVPGDAREVRARLVRSDEGYGFDLHSGQQVKGRMGWLQHASARLMPLAGVAPRIDVTAIAARLPAPELGAGLVSPQEAHLNFGPRWRVLSSRTIGAGEGLAHLALPGAFQPETDQGWKLHPALLDLATGWAMGLIDGYRPDHLWVPVSYAGVRVYRPLPAQIVSHVRNSGANSAARGTAAFDVTLATPDGEVCIEINGFTIHRLEGGLKLAPPDPRGLEYDAPQSKAISPAEERLLHAFSQGIRPEEGADAFGRAVALGRSQIIVSSLDLPALIRGAVAVEETRAEGTSFERPDLDSDYTEPRNDIERTLVGFWQDLLGVAKVGVDDSFFDLGGHSLIAVRLFAMVKKAYRIDFPISVLFEAPTIAACAALIDDQIGPQDSAEPKPEAAKAPTRRFTHIVPMHRGEGGARTPFFLVAGMFGNVLNLRHLAQLLGGDRPFYGLQARGLYGDAVPHTDFVTAARDYIAEMRQVQPVGPYLLGGFSGGGLIAWEIARQLEAVGEAVPLVVLLDTPVPLRPALSKADKLMIRLAELRAEGPAFFARWWREKQAWKRAQADVSDQGEAEFHNAAIESAFRAALPLYDMTPRNGATVLFRPPLDKHWQVTGGRWVSAAREFVLHDNDLTRFAPGLEVIEVPGDHDSMVLEPNVRVLSARMRVVIESVEGPEPVTRLATAAE
ncbi:MAG: type I polyketide synthase [Pseudotabrizicola sp.]|uniref:type I polyketide synthase n=1 Tax=Pseudotabrizicola sp. TaxID=2939647 RepID=UPI00272F8075|nr:type I polyketide synthase [Pseudotabrizicola sp.]MDP2081863.1 beta-ketoacyl synthase N-terminal-like domain-containing protein [Pseudotabrizicola sp.]MDZ7573847.1 type I polyketide synthase [Pseudotabrizicola sp.]